MALTCRSCAMELRPEARFCDNCGAPIAGAPEPTRVAAERRQVTVMFCDVAGSTRLAERLDPEELRELIQAYHQLCAREIESAGGHLAQYLGDGVLAYFGYPVAHEHDAGAAVRTGLAIARAMEAQPERHGVRLAVRIGIHSGLVVAGEMGSREQRTQLPVGGTVNIAARLQGIAQPGTVVISDATLHLTRGFFECRDLGSPPIKGVSSPLRVYEVVDESGAANPIEAALPTGLTPLVGRESERSVLFERWNRARGGTGQVVFVEGDAGLGKSRLLYELKQHAADAPCWQLECRCSPHHENSALFPAIDLLRRAWRLERTEDPGERFERLEQAVAPYRASIPDAVALLAALLSLPLPEGQPPLDLTPQRQRQRTLEALVAVLIGMAQEKPLLLIVEDLHWIDPSSLEFLQLLLERVPAHRILLVLAFRPSFVPPWGDGAAVTEIALHRLAAREAADVVRLVAKGRELPAEVVQALCSRADGIPLYLEELTKMLLESGKLREHGGRYELTGPLAELEIPATLQESLMARLDRLASGKDVVQLGATIGRTFSWNLLRAVAQLDDDSLREELALLLDAEILHVTGTPPDSRYVFKHALIQEAAYESLLKHTRRDYHQRIAEILKAHFPEIVDTQPELLGHHWAGAGLPSEAITYFQRAGRRAIARSANAEATSHLERALELVGTLEHGPERTRRELEVRIDLGVALVASKGNAAPEVEENYARARELCDELGEDTHLFYNALSGIFLFHQTHGDLQTALDLTNQRMRLAERLGDPALLMQVHENLGTLAFWRGDFEVALPELEEALTRYDADRARELALVYGTESSVVCETYAAHVLWFLGYPDQALRRCQRSVQLARKLGNANSLGLALAFAAALHHLRREPARTQTFADETVAFSTEQQLPLWIGFGMIFQGLARAAQGEAQPGIDRMLAGVASFQQTGAGLGAPLCLAMLSEAHLKAGRADEGLAMLNGGLQLVGEYEDVFFDAEVQRVRGCLLLAASSGDPAEAEKCLLAAIERARSQEARMLELRAATDLARLWQRNGAPERAHALLEGVYRGFDEGFETVDLEEAALLLSELSGAPARTSR